MKKNYLALMVYEICMNHLSDLERDKQIVDVLEKFEKEIREDERNRLLSGNNNTNNAESKERINDIRLVKSDVLRTGDNISVSTDFGRNEATGIINPLSKEEIDGFLKNKSED